MNLFVSNNSEVPIYQQVKNQIKDEILKGNLTDGELLPSIRGLANDISVSVLTTKRAYDELVDEGFIIAVQGKGFYVATKNLSLLKEEKTKEIEAKLIEAIEMAQTVGVHNDELKMMLDILISDNGGR